MEQAGDRQGLSLAEFHRGMRLAAGQPWNRRPAGYQRGLGGAVDFTHLGVHSEPNDVIILNERNKTEADAELLNCLIKGELEEQFDVVAAHYRRAIGTGSTQREVLSIVQHLAFLEEMLSGARRNIDPDDKQVRALARLRSQLSPVP